MANMIVWMFAHRNRVRLAEAILSNREILGERSPSRINILQPTECAYPGTPAMVLNIFTVPTPIRQLFDQFPLQTYPSNELPYHAHHKYHVLYVFATKEGAAAGAPSYNPACLKWQVRCNGI